MSVFIADPLHLLCNFDDDMSHCQIHHDQSANDTWDVVISEVAKDKEWSENMLRDNTLDSGTNNLQCIRGSNFILEL